jgi:hypothetical protein
VLLAACHPEAPAEGSALLFSVGGADSSATPQNDTASMESAHPILPLRLAVISHDPLSDAARFVGTLTFHSCNKDRLNRFRWDIFE